MNGVEVSVMGWASTVVNVSPCTRPSCEEQSCVSKPMCSCQLDQFHGVDVCCQVWTLCKAFRKWNGFGDDVVAEQSSHPCLVVYDAMSHVTPCVFLSSESWLKQCAFMKCLLCLWNEWIHRSPFGCAKNAHSGFTNLHSKCT